MSWIFLRLLNARGELDIFKDDVNLDVKFAEAKGFISTRLVLVICSGFTSIPEDSPIGVKVALDTLKLLDDVAKANGGVSLNMMRKDPLLLCVDDIFDSV